MKTISEIESQIRDYINSPRKQYMLLKDHAAWNKLCSSLDVIGDTELAIDAYIKMSMPKSGGENYVVLYGILQILFVQQDAVSHLAEALDISYSADPMITEIREVRNNSVGHPTKRGGGKGKAFNFISRISMSKSCFTLLTTFENGESKFQDVNVMDLIKSQRSILQITLAGVIQKLRDEEAKHREQFRVEKLAEIFPQTLGYYFEKIIESIHETKPFELGSFHVKIVIETIAKFKESLDQRGILEAQELIKYEIGLIEYPLEELRKFFDTPRESRLNGNDAYIFTFFAKKSINSLIEIAKEIDEEYAEEP